MSLKCYLNALKIIVLLIESLKTYITFLIIKFYY